MNSKGTFHITQWKGLQPLSKPLPWILSFHFEQVIRNSNVHCLEGIGVMFFLCLWGKPGLQLVFSPFGDTKCNLNAIYLKASKTVLRWCCYGFGNWPTLSYDQVTKEKVHPTIKFFKHLLHHHHWSLTLSMKPKCLHVEKCLLLVQNAFELLDLC